MSLNREIMNIQISQEAKDYYVDEDGLKTSEYYVYKLGHRDARHDAAELSIAYEQRIEALEEVLKQLVDENDKYMPDETKQWRYSPMRAECLKLLGVEE